MEGETIMADTFFNRSVEEVLQEQESSSGGLSNAQAADRLKKYGPNALVEGKKKGVLQVFLEQFKDLLVVILIVAAIISMLSGQGESTIVIFAVLILNAILGTVQYFKAEKSLESLKAMSSPTAKVLRGGAKVEVPSKEVVPGDIVFLEAGDLVVADGRVIENFSLKVNESSLTGESEGVEKTEEVIPGEKVALGDQKNMVFSGSLVTYGRATVVVTGTGMHTEIGKIASLMNQTQQRKTPLQQSLPAHCPTRTDTAVHRTSPCCGPAGNTAHRGRAVSSERSWRGGHPALSGCRPARQNSRSRLWSGWTRHGPDGRFRSRGCPVRRGTRPAACSGR